MGNIDLFNIANNDEKTLKEFERIKRKLFEAEKYKLEYEKAEVVVSKVLEDNPDINVDCVIKSLKSKILSTTRCAKKLGISPRAFLRLRKKYNIHPVAEVKNNDNQKKFAPHFSKKAIRNYYNDFQLQRIPKEEIELAQIRAARSLKLPNKVLWEPRGYHYNGKLQARTEYLTKFGVHSRYLAKEDIYIVRLKDGTEQKLTKKEVDNLNLKFARLKGFM